MLSHIFLGMSLVGAEWVLYLLILLSVISVAVMIERARFYRSANREIRDFRESIRKAAAEGKWDQARQLAQTRVTARQGGEADLEAEMSLALLNEARGAERPSTAILEQLAADSIGRARLHWDRNLAILATIGSNAPFVGLFGTVLGIIKAFHDLSKQVGAGAQTVTAGISEALIATAIGILVAVPAVVAFNLFQRRVRTALVEAEALRSFLVGKLAK